MYTQFGANQNAQFNEALKTINSTEATDIQYQKALRSALEALSQSYPADGKKLEWAAELVSAYREIGGSLVKYLDGNLPSGELNALEREFSGILSDYTAESLAGKMKLILSGLNKLPWSDLPDNLPDHQEATITNRIASIFEDYNEIAGAMRVHDIKDGKSLEAALKERDNLREQMDLFDRKF